MLCSAAGYARKKFGHGGELAIAGVDILILMDAPVVPGCVTKARPIGAIEAKQKAKGEDWERNDRLIGSALHSQTHDDAKSLADLRPHLVNEIKEFFVNYNKLRVEVQAASRSRVARSGEADRGRDEDVQKTEWLKIRSRSDLACRSMNPTLV